MDFYDLFQEIWRSGIWIISMMIIYYVTAFAAACGVISAVRLFAKKLSIFGHKCDKL